MGAELVAAMRADARDLPSITELSVEDAADYLRALIATYVQDPNRVWLWESLKPPHKEFCYGDGNGLQLVCDLIRGNPRVCLMVTDDESPPWPAFEGSLQQIVELIGRQHFFEYALVDPKLDWVLFDTHHNSIVVAGSLASSVLNNSLD